MRWLAEDHDRIRSLIERVIPGFDYFNSRVNVAGGLYLPNPAKQRVWDAPSGKAGSTCKPSAATISSTPPSTAWTTVVAASANACFPEANVLVPATSQAEGGGAPPSKAVEIEIRSGDLIVGSSSSPNPKRGQ